MAKTGHRRQCWAIAVLAFVMIVACTLRFAFAVRDLSEGDETAFLSYPLAVITPALAFAYLARIKSFRTAEGALMQLGALIQLTAIVALPSLALPLALGFPAAFLAVELFETRLPRRLRDPLRRRLLA